MSVTLLQGDCLDLLPTLPAQSVEAIITDLPYGTTACKWDSIIPFEPMWREIKRILKPRGVFVTTASQPFTSRLVMSNPEHFQYSWIWQKSRATGHLDCKRKPLKKHEDVCVFADGAHTYNPQMTVGRKHSRGGASPGPAQVWGKFTDRRTTESEDYYPLSIIAFSTIQQPEHPTQKPVALYEYLIRTYTNEGDTVLDFCAGSGTTGIAAHNTGRNAILIEKEADYCAIIERRIAEAEAQPSLLGAA